MKLRKTLLAALTLMLTIVTSATSFSITLVEAPNDPNMVYVVICIDTECWDGHIPYFGSSDPHPTIDVREYARSPPSTVSQVFESGFRNSHRDSFGNIFKMTWFAEMDYLMAQGDFVYADGSPAGVSGYTAIHDILMNNWGAEIQTYSDSIEYHHHLWIYDETWEVYENGPDEGYPEYQMYALDHMIIDRNFYPSTFRSGWLLMPPALSNWLEQWMPFDYTPNIGYWYPVHPSGMNRWQTTAETWVTEWAVNDAFATARDHGDAIYSFYCHDIDDMAGLINELQVYLDAADADEATYPDVSFEYVSAREAMQRALGFTDFTPPTFTITSSGGTYTIVSSESLWANHPYVALKYTDGTYMHVEAAPTGTNTWDLTPPNGELLEKIGIAASDLYGNPGVWVDTPMSIAISPTHVAMNVGQSQTFSSSVSGGTPPYTYQWYLNDTAVSGATGSTWTFKPATTGHYKVYLDVTDVLNFEAQSNIVTDIVVYPQLTVSISPVSVNMTVGGSQTFSSAVSGGAPPYSYQWYRNGTLVPGATSASWTFTPMSAGTYKIHLRVADTNTAVAQSNNATARVETPMTITISPTQVKMYVGQSQTFNSSVSGGTPPLSYQWYLNDTAVPGATNLTWAFTPRSAGHYKVYLNVTDGFNFRAQSNVVGDILVCSVYLLLTMGPAQGASVGGQSVTFAVNVFNQLDPVLESSLTLAVTGPRNCGYFDVQPVRVPTGTVGEYSFTWVVPDVAGTYLVEVGLVPAQLTAYDAFWLEVA